MEFEIVGEDGTAGTSIPSSGSMSILFVSRFLGMAVSHRGSAASGPGREHQQSPRADADGGWRACIRGLGLVMHGVLLRGLVLG
jgi:hypothetical protein